MPKLFTGLDLGHLECRHRVIMDLPFRAGPNAAADLRRLSRALVGSAVIHDLGPSIEGMGQIDAARNTLAAQWLKSAHGHGRWSIARIRVDLSGPRAGMRWEHSAAWARNRGYDGVELDLSQAKAAVAADTLEELLGDVPDFLDRTQLGLRLSGLRSAALPVSEALALARDYEVAYVHLTGLPSWTTGWPSCRRATEIRTAFPGVIVAAGCNRVAAAVHLVEDRWADAVSFSLSDPRAPGLLSEFKRRFNIHSPPRNGAL
ncbi:hypothetical protein [Microvirga yunnanensis]|uniref:hypothetical protein n=1 Tax=Microvirga yunnanensis TaxID=2953740 RepID=UPI0021C81E9F|nr:MULTISPECIES: hypothetical protein [unclassified Microvirga]